MLLLYLIRGEYMKKNTKIIIAISLAVAIILAGLYIFVFKKDKPIIDTTIDVTTSDTTPQTTTDSTDDNSVDLPKPNKSEVIQSATVDLDADGINEQVQIIENLYTGDTNEIEGVLKITGKDKTIEIAYVKKPDGDTGIISNIEFYDLDGDRKKDVFIRIPGAGAAFSLNYYYIYNYMTGKSYLYSTDSSFLDFAANFKFDYTGKGVLDISNDYHKFSAVFNLTASDGLDKEEESNESYSNSWIEPTPVEISENSKLAIVTSENGTNQIKIPFPIFGRSTMEMIGELDVYYEVGSDFKPVMKRFEVIDYNGDEMDVIGSKEIS
jgi:hypothetical protein